MNSADRDPQLERILREALASEAAKTTPAGDGLARIRARTSSRTGFAGLFRPAVAGAALTFTLVAGTLIGINAKQDDTRTDIAQPAASGAPAVVDEPVAEQPPVKQPANPPVLLPPLNTRKPTAVPTSGSELSAKLAPATGLATPEAQVECVPNTTVPTDDGGNYIAITSPGSGCPLRGPSITVAGTARVFEAALSIDVMQNGAVLQTANVMASEGAPGLGTWTTQFTLLPGDYRIEAYYESAMDGSRMTMDTIWITVEEAYVRGE
ncbi:MAG: Gmad2 immunoglobulin-like domain-containing protein [Sporichthyaceae bacterium]